MRKLDLKHILYYEWLFGEGKVLSLTGKCVKIWKKNNQKKFFVRKNQEFSQLQDGAYHFLMPCLILMYVYFY